MRALGYDYVSYLQLIGLERCRKLVDRKKREHKAAHAQTTSSGHVQLCSLSSVNKNNIINLVNITFEIAIDSSHYVSLPIVQRSIREYHLISLKTLNHQMKPRFSSSSTCC